MPTKNVKQLVAETRQLITEVEAGDTDHAAWIAIQDRVERLCENESQRGVGRLLGKQESWVRDVRRWDAARGRTPFSSAARDRDHDRNLRGAKKVLRDPDERAKVIESMGFEERLEIAQAAMEPEARENRRSSKENTAHRESRPARERGVVELISSLLDGADLNILRAITTAQQTAWDDPEVNAMAEGRIDRTLMRLDLLRMAVRSEGDLEAELAKIEEES